MNKKIIRIPKELLEKEENIITNKEALKDVVPVNWDEMIVKEESSEYKRSNKINDKKEEKLNEKSR